MCVYAHGNQKVAWKPMALSFQAAVSHLMSVLGTDHSFCAVLKHSPFSSPSMWVLKLCVGYSLDKTRGDSAPFQSLLLVWRCQECELLCLLKVLSWYCHHPTTCLTFFFPSLFLSIVAN